MTVSQKNTMIEEIDEAFLDCYMNRITEFMLRFPSLMVDGELKTYPECLPDHIFNRVLEKYPNRI